ncbi:MAG: efflux RND transporter periplasmic adaptor subunit [Candidatus Schekmanbacteria bacterium]|nr:MAG: efflux RND transporter periplasmic adaptor subunit [Candidatus Schekmanbacteria bacterium]
MKRKTLLFSLIIALAVLVGAYYFFKPPKEYNVEYITAPVTRGKIIQKVTATGTVNPKALVIIGSQVSGKVSEIYVDYNSRVKKGQLLAKIDPQLFQARVDQARYNLRLAKNNLEKNEVLLRDAELKLKRIKALNEAGFASDQELDSAQNAYDSALAQVEVSRAQVEQQKANLEEAETNLKYTNIISPVDGIIVSRNVDVGQTIVASLQTPTLFLAAKDLSVMQIETNVDEADIGRVKVGEDVEFTVDAYPDRVFNGKVSQIRISPQTVQNVVTYVVIIDVDNSDLILKPGMTANVNITTGVKDNVLRIPNAALRFMPREEKEKMRRNENYKKYISRGVWKLVSEREIKRVEVKTGISNSQYTELVEGEISEGDKLVIDAIYED